MYCELRYATERANRQSKLKDFEKSLDSCIHHIHVNRVTTFLKKNEKHLPLDCFCTYKI